MTENLERLSIQAFSKLPDELKLEFVKRNQLGSEHRQSRIFMDTSICARILVKFLSKKWWHVEPTEGGFSVIDLEVPFRTTIVCNILASDHDGDDVMAYRVAILVAAAQPIEWKFVDGTENVL